MRVRRIQVELNEVAWARSAGPTGQTVRGQHGRQAGLCQWGGSQNETTTSEPWTSRYRR